MNQKKIPIKFPLLNAKDFYWIWAKDLQTTHRFLGTARNIHLVQSAHCTHEEPKAQKKESDLPKSSQQVSVADLGPWTL